MESLRNLVHQLAEEGTLISATLSQVRKAGDVSYTKVVVKPVELKKSLHYQLAYHYANKVTHENIEASLFEAKIMELFENRFRQGLLCTPQADYQVLISKNTKYRS